MSGNLSPGWALVSLRDLAANERGAITDGPFGSKLKTEHYTDRGPRVIRLQNIGDGVFQDAKAHISPKHFASLTKHAVIEGDLVIAALGEVLPRSCIIPASLGPAIVKADCLRLRPHPQLVGSSFLNYALNSEVLRKQAEAIVHGVGRPRLNMGEMTSLTVPLAPPREQQRIVAALDERLSELDASVASLERAERNLVRYRAAVLAAACSGKLVPTEAELAKTWDRGPLARLGSERPSGPRSQGYEPADQLLARILAERRKASTKTKYEEPSQPDTSKLPKLPEGWVWATMDHLLTRIETGASFSCDERPPVEGEIGVVKVSAVTWGTYDEDASKTCMDPDRVDLSILVRTGDFLFSRANSIELIGACVIAERVTKKIMLSDKILRFHFAGADRRWVLLCLRSAFGRRAIQELSTGNQMSMRNIGQDRIRAIPMPMPPEAEQSRILEEVDRHLSRADALAASIAQSKRRAQRLRRAILAAAFQGRLVPQDPNDEPASVLLDRIRSQVPLPGTARGPRASKAAPERASGARSQGIASTTTSAMTPKRRGRPPGSKNKAKA